MAAAVVRLVVESSRGFVESRSHGMSGGVVRTSPITAEHGGRPKGAAVTQECGSVAEPQCEATAGQVTGTIALSAASQGINGLLCDIWDWQQ